MANIVRFFVKKGASGAVSVINAFCIKVLSMIVSLVVRAARAMKLKYLPASATSFKLVLKAHDWCNCLMVAPCSVFLHHAMAMPLASPTISLHVQRICERHELTDGDAKTEISYVIHLTQYDIGRKMRVKRPKAL